MILQGDLDNQNDDLLRDFLTTEEQLKARWAPYYWSRIGLKISEVDTIRRDFILLDMFFRGLLEYFLKNEKEISTLILREFETADSLLLAKQGLTSGDAYTVRIMSAKRDLARQGRRNNDENYIARIHIMINGIVSDDMTMVRFALCVEPLSII